MATTQKPPFGLHVPKNGKTWVYDFRVNGARYSRSTRKRSLTEAKKVAAKAYAEATEEGALTRERRKPEITLRELMGRFYLDKVQHHKNAKNELGQLARIAEGLGPDVLLSRITYADLTAYQRQRKSTGLAGRTVNAEVPILLRQAVAHAKLLKYECGDLGDHDFAWNSLKLPVSAPRIRAANRQEQFLLFHHLRKDYRRLLLFALLTGLRRRSLLITKRQVDFAADVIYYEKKSKQTNNVGVIPMTNRIRRLVQHELLLSPPDCEYVFTYVCEQPGQGREVGKRYPITYSGFGTVMKRVVKKADLKDWRLIHDLRHTAATETLRRSQNLAAVQQMLGHSEIGQTSRYAHVLVEDTRKAMEGQRGR